MYIFHNILPSIKNINKPPCPLFIKHVRNAFENPPDAKHADILAEHLGP